VDILEFEGSFACHGSRADDLDRCTVNHDKADPASPATYPNEEPAMKHRLFFIAALSACALATAQSDPQLAPINENLITQPESLAIAQAAIQSCKAKGMSVNVEVADADGHLRVALASQGATLAGIRTAPQKLASVLDFHVSTRALKARLADDPDFAARFGKDPRYHFSPGGLPIYKSGKFVAVIAVGGGGTIDESCAIEALKLLPWATTDN
jgi:uncharacterized protein GlcG (DUF336 family)